MDEFQASLEEVQAMFHHKPAPAGLLAHLVEHDDGAYYAVRVYKDQYDKLAKPDQLSALNWINDTVVNIRVVAHCILEVWKRPGVPE